MSLRIYIVVVGFFVFQGVLSLFYKLYIKKYYRWDTEGLTVANKFLKNQKPKAHSVGIIHRPH